MHGRQKKKSLRIPFEHLQKPGLKIKKVTLMNGFDIPGTFLFRTLIGKIFGSIGSVGGGLALGKEGPLVHTGAYIASLLGQGGSTKYHLNSRWQQFFKSDRDRRDLVTCGCAAGVAAAFRGGQIMVFLEAEKGYRSLIKIVIALGEDPPRVCVHCVG
ncbi:hypothetical protein ARALYDRAFT_357249 [Arabidopsis lyrata subsp. lyrata]|uniref:Uncharacterized protein n=1 Tax=Arabidopsis lyrata subsp. lyrata TaxID=81972 RepID=D7MPH2_ARALL|nr:hypothetical protein ARALYDRAFT_357249 [Arabidopsis lyrata subsp. lyrata]